jgi:hypothetical protein
MNAAQLIERLRDSGIFLVVDNDGGLIVRATKPLTEQQRQWLVNHKVMLTDWLTWEAPAPGYCGLSKRRWAELWAYIPLRVCSLGRVHFDTLLEDFPGETIEMIAGVCNQLEVAGLLEIEDSEWLSIPTTAAKPATKPEPEAAALDYSYIGHGRVWAYVLMGEDTERTYYAGQDVEAADAAAAITALHPGQLFRRMYATQQDHRTAPARAGNPEMVNTVPNLADY